MDFKPKQELYKTAFCPARKKFVGIKKAVKTDAGNWKFQCTIAGEPRDKLRWFDECQLENFVL